MLPSKNRLAKDWAINKVRRRGRKLKTKYFQISSLPRKRSGESRFAFVVPIRYSKKATERNLLKRRARSSIKTHLSKIKRGYDFVLAFFPEAKDLGAQELLLELENSLRRGNYLLTK
ncbi:ribonuclease P protein component [Patescibacteria group bacterium]